MFKKIFSVAVVGLMTVQAQANVVESFDSGVWGAGWSNSSAGTVNAGAAHDGAYGVTLDSATWTYNSSIVFDAGSTLSAWVRPTAGSYGRAYFGFGADAGGANSFVTATNTSDIKFQDNSGYSFVDLTLSPQTFANSWYRISVTRSADGTSAVGSLFGSDGTTLLNSVTQTGINRTATGVALRGFGGFDVDTLSVTAVPEPETYAMMLVGLGLIGGMARRRKLKVVTA